MTVWPMVELGDLASWGSGGTPSRSRREFFEGSIPWAAIGDLTDGDVWRTEESITSEALNSSSAKMVPAGSLMIAMYGSIGKLGIPRIELATNQAIAFATPGDRLDLRYLYHCMRRDRARLLASGNGGTQSNISQTKLKAWKIPLPPLPEQRRIAAILDHVDALRTKRRESLWLLDELSIAIFTHAISISLEKRTVGEILKTRSGGFLPAKAMTPDGKYPVYGGNGINGSHSAWNVEGGTVVIGRVGANCGAVHLLNARSWVTDNALIVIPQVEMAPIYLSSVLKHAKLNQYAKVSGQPSLSFPSIKDVNLPFLTLDSQEQYRYKIDRIQSVRTRLEESKIDLLALSNSIQYRAFRGMLEIKQT